MWKRGGGGEERTMSGRRIEAADVEERHYDRDREIERGDEIGNAGLQGWEV